MLRILQCFCFATLAVVAIGCGGAKPDAPSTDASPSAIAEEDARVHQLESQQ